MNLKWPNKNLGPNYALEAFLKFAFDYMSMNNNGVSLMRNPGLIVYNLSFIIL